MTRVQQKLIAQMRRESRTGIYWYKSNAEILDFLRSNPEGRALLHAARSYYWFSFLLDKLIPLTERKAS